ncbi:3-dehydroquinate synthase [Compostibacter hankyongensis]|uniref:3-dehydroquinate synthase n=1 Tax=Compostibacter hankyongensis TaxID=1007089 RepID=A0ABP8FV94_9BACT
MRAQQYKFSQQAVDYYLGESIAQLKQYADPQRSLLLIDENVNRLHGDKLEGWQKVTIPSGEEYKDLKVFQEIVDALIRLEADRKTMLIGIGGGVVTDLTGFVASVYMRGVPFAFVPTTLLAQVDASIGGKNGINYGRYKNMLGIIRQPVFILFDYDLLRTLPEDEWHNGFAEVIKYACIQDASLFDFLEQKRDQALSGDPEILSYLVERSVAIKSGIVQEDEFESGSRRWLNFGHTIGHAVEKLEQIAHGKAVAMGMVAASRLSQRLNGFPEADTVRITRLIESYGLPVKISSNTEAVYNLLRMDKKREKEFIHFILLKQVGEAVTVPIPLEQLKAELESF